MKLHDVLNRQIANWNVLYVKLHHYHWFVKGEQFFTLHAKFEELYNEAAAYIDDLAERLLTIGGKPAATLKQYLELATIREATGSETAEQMVKTLAEDFSSVVRELKQGVEIAGEEKDEVTADLLLSIQANVEKQVWMLKAYLGTSV
jgi:starvation-inducible DNA-binding protein